MAGLPTLPVLPGGRVIRRDCIESDVDDRLRHPIDPGEEDGYGSPAVRSWLPGFWQRQVRLGLVAVAAAVLLLDLVAGFGRAGDGAVGAAFGDARLAAKSRTRTSGSWAMHGSARAWLARKVQFATIKHVTKF